MTWIITSTERLSSDALEHIREELREWTDNPRPIVLADGLVLHDTDTGRSYGKRTVGIRTRVNDWTSVDGTGADGYGLTVGTEVEVVGFMGTSGGLSAVVIVDGRFTQVPDWYLTPIQPAEVIAI